jgi:hypothetical protein
MDEEDDDEMADDEQGEEQQSNIVSERFGRNANAPRKSNRPRPSPAQCLGNDCSFVDNLAFV